MRRPPRSPSTPSRESRRLVLIRDAFYRQGTLHRIRWPLQPRSRDRHTVFRTMGRPLNGTLAPPWVFVRSSPVRSGRVRLTTLLSPAAPADGFTHRRSLRARSPFTRPCRSFCCAIAELIRDQTSPDDFCNCNSRYEQPNQGSRVLAGTMASTTFRFLHTTPSPLRKR